jgi:hypothetical protein
LKKIDWAFGYYMVLVAMMSSPIGYWFGERHAKQEPSHINADNKDYYIKWLQDGYNEVLEQYHQCQNTKCAIPECPCGDIVHTLNECSYKLNVARDGIKQMLAQIEATGKGF